MKGLVIIAAIAAGAVLIRRVKPARHRAPPQGAYRGAGWLFADDEARERHEAQHLPDDESGSAGIRLDWLQDYPTEAP